MSPITLGILAASGAATVGSYELITSTVLTSNAATIDFTGLSTAAASYKHLQLRIVGRTTQAVADSNIQLRFNNDSGANYSGHVLYGNGSSVVSAGGGGSTGITVGEMVGSTGTTNAFGAAIIDILDINGTKNKTVRSLSGFAQSANFIVLRSGAWYSTAAITSINLYYPSTSFVTNSRFSLYGLRG